MRTASAKAKGRRAAAETRDLLLAWAPALGPNDITVTPSGCTGPDLHFSEAALKVYPWAVENKNVEKLNVWSAIEQANAHAQGTGRVPIVFFRRNRSELIAMMRAVDFMEYAGPMRPGQKNEEPA